MPITPSDLQATNYGYLSGADLATWCNIQLLIAQINVRPNIIQKAVNTAIAEVVSKLSNVYDLTTELQKTDSIAPIIAFTLTGGVISAVTIIHPGTNFIAAPTIIIKDNNGINANITAQVSDSTVQTVKMLQGGKGYREPPTVSFVGGNPTRPAAGVATLDSCGRVIGVVITDAGSGYQTTPAVVFTPVSGGQFAQAVATIQYGHLTGLTIVSGGTGYAAPSATFSGGQINDPREPKLVKIVSIFAVRNAMGSNHNIAEKMMEDFKSADSEIQELRANLDSLPLYQAIKQIRSEATTVKDSFSQLG